jgi:hypothetical protein
MRAANLQPYLAQFSQGTSGSCHCPSNIRLLSQFTGFSRQGNESCHADGTSKSLFDFILVYAMCEPTERLPIPTASGHYSCFLTKDLQESPHPHAAEDRYRQVVIPSKDVNNFAR